jgi:hypothetical protein
VAALDAKIDELYRLPLGEFTSARNALAKTLPKDEATQVKALEKPTVVPWAVNQVYWRARSTYDRVMKSGEKLRAAQIAALEGKHADVRGTGEAHRRAIGEAVAEAERLAAESGAKPGADALARTFESLSLATSASTAPGRLTEVLQPAGFEALMGVAPQPASGRTHGSAPTLSVVGHRRVGAESGDAESERRPTAAQKAAAKAAERAAEQEAARLAAEQKKHAAAVEAASAHLERVQAAEQKAREAWEKAHDELLAARQALTDVRRARFTKPTT